MVLVSTAEARRQRVLKKRQCAKLENHTFMTNKKLKQDDVNAHRITSFEDNSNQTHPEKKSQSYISDDSTETDTSNSEDDMNDKATNQELDVPDTRVMIANVYRYLRQEYKYIQLVNGDNTQLRPLAAIHRRTAEATGLSKDVVKKIVKKDRMRIAEKPNRNNEQQSITP